MMDIKFLLRSCDSSCDGEWTVGQSILPRQRSNFCGTRSTQIEGRSHVLKGTDIIDVSAEIDVHFPKLPMESKLSSAEIDQLLDRRSTYSKGQGYSCALFVIGRCCLIKRPSEVNGERVTVKDLSDVRPQMTDWGIGDLQGNFGTDQLSLFD